MQNSKIQNTFESLELLTKKAVQPVKQTATDVGRDIKESLGLSVGQDTFGLEQLQSMPAKQKQQVKQADAAKQAVIRQNIARINQQIMEARKKREQADQARRAPQASQAKREQKVAEKQKKESVLAKMIKSRQGSKEAMQRASG